MLIRVLPRILQNGAAKITSNIAMVRSRVPLPNITWKPTGTQKIPKTSKRALNAIVENLLEPHMYLKQYTKISKKSLKGNARYFWGPATPQRAPFEEAPSVASESLPGCRWRRNRRRSQHGDQDISWDR